MILVFFFFLPLFGGVVVAAEEGKKWAQLILTVAGSFLLGRSFPNTSNIDLLNMLGFLLFVPGLCLIAWLIFTKNDNRPLWDTATVLSIVGLILIGLTIG